MLVFVKLGGSLITNKKKMSTARREVIGKLLLQIAFARFDDPDLQIILGHGSGSFGHVPAKRWGTRQGVFNREQWNGFLEVWREAEKLNHIFMDECWEVDLPTISCAPHASVVASGGKAAGWDLRPVRMALDAGLIPVVYGDVIFDEKIGGTILSTEDLFHYLALELKPRRVLLAGIEPGVWRDYPDCTSIIEIITPSNIDQLGGSLTGSAATDVTGGMASKVQDSLDLVQQIPGLEVVIFSGEQPNLLRKVLLGESAGTVIKAEME